MVEHYTKHLFKHSLIYGSGEILSRFLGFALLPVYTRYLLPEEYGILQLLLITLNLATIFVQLGLGSAIFKSVLYDRDANKNSVYSSALYFLMGISVLLILPALFLSEQISLIIVGSPQYGFAVKILFLSILLKNFSLIPFAKLRIENKSAQYATLAFLKFGLQLILNIYFVVFLEKGILGIIYAEFFSSLVFAFIFFWIISGNLVRQFSTRAIKNMLAFGIPLVPAALAMFVINMSNRYFLEHFATLEEVGLFSLGFRFGIVIALAVSAFQRAWPTTMFNIAEEKNAGQIYAQNFTRFVLFLTLLALCVSLFAKEMLTLMTTGKFIESYRIVPFICLSYLFYGIYFYTAVGLNLKRKTGYQAIVVAVAAVLCLALNYWLIPRYGMMGAALSNSVSFVVMGLMAAKISNHFYPIPYEFNRLFKIGLVSIPIFLLGYQMQMSDLWVSLLFKTFLSISFPIILYFLGFFDEAEQKKLKNIVFYFNPTKLLYRLK